ncbi:hypothetical protein niasHT_021738 [Heterodera trifolii]|uniref:Transposase n=1 Tax=Heterodera trifolii TaxID=157864 RepID=A0ABD2KRQ3_9BILA
MVDTDVQIPSTPADDDQQTEPMPSTSTARCDLMATPSTSKCAGGFGLDDVRMFDELRRRHVWIEEELKRQRRSNAFLRKQLKAQRDRSTSLERSASACRQRKALSDVTNTQQGDNRLSAANDLLFTLHLGLCHLVQGPCGNDDRTNLENKFGSIFAQLNQLKTVSLEIAGRKRTIPIQIPQIHFGTDVTPRFCSDFSLSTLHSSEEPIDGQNCGCPPVASPTPKFVHWPSTRQHCLGGCNGQRIIDAICSEADARGKGDDVRKRLSDAGVRRYPRTKQFTGGDIYKIIDHENFAAFTAPIPPGTLKFMLIDAMNDLRHIYRLSRAKFLHPGELNSLEHWTKMFYCHWQQLGTIDAARYPVRPKLHLLAAHVVPFARTHLWWGLISEQGMEHMHRMCNNLVGRYAHLGTPEKVVEKLVKHTTLLNALHDRGVEITIALRLDNYQKSYT